MDSQTQETTMRMLSLALAGSAAALSGCGTGSGGAIAPAGAGRAAVYLTDAPFPFAGVARVDMHVVRIELSPQVDTAAAPAAWITVATPDRTFNLLDLQNGATELLGEAQIPAGSYAAVRVTIDPARSGMTGASGGAIVAVAGPVGPGIDWGTAVQAPVLYAQVEEPMSVDEQGQDIVIDFDVGRSFQYNGGGRFTFVPWLRAITRAGSGSVTGVVRRLDTGAAIADATVSLTVASDTALALYVPIATSRTGSDGRFAASFLRPGRYDVVVTDPGSGRDSEAKRVEVRAGGSADAGIFGF
ncbi:MAG: DUF4382 domain-containing protein [Deltaproteobacteria bacterium]